jgi:ATP-binding cassette, subfamily C (CFTR/MRP), member 4
MHTISKNSVI